MPAVYVAVIPLLPRLILRLDAETDPVRRAALLREIKALEDAAKIEKPKAGRPRGDNRPKFFKPREFRSGVDGA